MNQERQYFYKKIVIIKSTFQLKLIQENSQLKTIKETPENDPFKDSRTLTLCLVAAQLYLDILNHPNPPDITHVALIATRALELPLLDPHFLKNQKLIDEC